MRYSGFPSGRVELDYSSMVSAYFYDLNLTNPDPSRSSLPRLSSSDPIGLAQVKSDLQQVLSRRQLSTTVSINWQGVADMIVTRYSDRLRFMASSNEVTQRDLLAELNFLLTMFVDSATEIDVNGSIEKCTRHYLKHLRLQTVEDVLIYTSVLAVSLRICATLFEACDIVKTEIADDTAAKVVRLAVKKLMSFLNWSTWLECGKCGFDEVCFCAIWPWGTVEDHEQPSCLKRTDLTGHRGYWDWNPLPRPPKDPKLF